MKKNISNKKNDVDSFKASQKEFIEHSKLMLEMQQRLRSEKHVFTEKINKTA